MVTEDELSLKCSLRACKSIRQFVGKNSMGRCNEEQKRQELLRKKCKSERRGFY